MADINRLPYEVLLHIFRYYLQTESQQNFMNCISNVCKKWREVCMDSSHFQNIDGSLPLQTLISLGKSGSLKKTKVFKFGSIRKDSLSKGSLKKLYSNLPCLKSLNLENVCSRFEKKKEHSVLTELKDFCPDLCELVLCHPEKACKARISPQIFEEFVQLRGPKLVTLDFSYVNIPEIKKLFLIIANNCPSLEELIVQGLNECRYSNYFPIENMQVGCQKLKTLRLGYPIIYQNKINIDPIGFPSLEIFTHPSRDDLHFKDSSFTNLLSKSHNLKALDIRGCLHVTVESVYSLPTVNLEQIYLSYTRITKNTDAVTILQKWSHSLKVVDLSHSSGDFVNRVLGPSSLPNGLPELESLDINCTQVSICTLRHIIQNAPKLSLLQLESCRCLGRGMKHVYRSRVSIEELLLKLDEIEME